jgi:trimeric autotransporter adhesin
MSTKTTFKRVALVAVAALGLGVLSVAPSSATVSSLTTSVVAGSAASGASDSTTAAIVTINGFVNNSRDTITVQFIEDGARPVANVGTAGVPRINILDTTTADTKAQPFNGNGNEGTLWDGFALIDSAAVNTEAHEFYSTTSNRSIGVKFGVQLDSVTTLRYGTYNYQMVITQYNHAAGTATQTIATTVVPFSIVVATPSTASKTASQVYSTLGAVTASSAVATVSTDNTAAGTLTLTQLNAANTASADESVTVTVTGPGTVGAGTVRGKSVVLAYTAGSALAISYWADGTAGTSSITVSTPSLTFAPQTVTYYAKAAKTLDAKVAAPVLKVGTNDSAVAVTAVDANGTNWSGAAYIVASAAADALVGGSATTPVACSYQSSNKTHWCPVSTIATGTAKFKVIDAATVALATATSSEVTVTVSNSAPTTVALAFDKATYQPFEKAIIRITVLGADGKNLSGQTFANLLASGGISSNLAFSTVTTAVDLTPVSITTESVDGTDKFAGSKTYVVYMPAAGDVTISATGGTSLAAAGQVKVSATASVVNSSVDAATDAANEATDAANAATDAALAAADAADAATAAAQDASDAVAALSASVSKLISSLRAQITSLTNLVIKIQKKVRA